MGGICVARDEKGLDKTGREEEASSQVEALLSS